MVDLSLLTDGLRAEREQGITIDVAYRYFSTARRKFIIADTPGHEQYLSLIHISWSTCAMIAMLRVFSLILKLGSCRFFIPRTTDPSACALIRSSLPAF